ncbi:MAG: hypothetical protein IH851_06360 [Armatimonadetes bacterium]|nr:hypothetical protein [Armatimonadota bacterium]
MNEIQRADVKNLASSLLSPARLLGFALAGWVGWLLMAQASWLWIGLAVWLFGGAVYANAVREDFFKRRFRTPEHRQLWDLVQDRLKRLRRAIKRAPAYVGSALEEMPGTVERTAERLYRSLRRADIVKGEIERSEGRLGPTSVTLKVQTADPETNELYVLADKNLAEYRKHFQTISAHVTRTEGQCAVFVSALDALRVQLLGHRLSEARPEVPMREFRETMGKVRGQLQAIERALRELESFGDVEAESLESEAASRTDVSLKPPP